MHPTLWRGEHIIPCQLVKLHVILVGVEPLGDVNIPCLSMTMPSNLPTFRLRMGAASPMPCGNNPVLESCFAQRAWKSCDARPNGFPVVRICPIMMVKIMTKCSSPATEKVLRVDGELKTWKT